MHINNPSRGVNENKRAQIRSMQCPLMRAEVNDLFETVPDPFDGVETNTLQSKHLKENFNLRKVRCEFVNRKRQLCTFQSGLKICDQTRALSGTIVFASDSLSGSMPGYEHNYLEIGLLHYMTQLLNYWLNIFRC